jgi:PTS system nitrogen regulatory IIA component
MSQNIFQSLLTIERCLCHAKVNNKADCLLELSMNLATPETPSEQILKALQEREQLGSTAIGHGLALPHARMKNISTCSLALLTLKKPIDYGSADDIPVSIICTLLVPECANDVHLQTLANLMELFQQPAFCKALRKAHNNTELYEIASHWNNDEH